MKGYTITNNDIAYPLYPREELLERFSLFSQQRGLGTFLGNNLAGTPQRFFEFLIMNLFSNSAEQIEFTVVNLLISLSAVYLLRSFFDVYRSWHFSILTILIALTQTWSLYLAFVWVRLQTIVYALIFLQLVFGLFIRFLDSTLQLRGFLVRFSFLSIVLGWSLGTQPPIMMIIITTFLCFITSLGIFQSYNKDFLFRSTATALGFSSFFYGVFNCWWILPLVKYSIRNDFFSKTVLQENFDVKSLVFFTSNPTSVFNSLRQLGDFAWFEGYWPELHPWLSNIPCMLVSLLIPLILVSGISKLTMENHNFSTFAIMMGSIILVISVFLTLGSLGPTGELYKWSLDNLPLFSLQRAPWQKFSILIWLFSPPLIFYTLSNLRPWRKSILGINLVQYFTSLILIISIVFGPMTLVARGAMFSKVGAIWMVIMRTTILVFT